MKLPNILFFVVFVSPRDVVGHRQEDVSCLKVFCEFQRIHKFLDLVENLQCSVSWENHPLELHGFRIDAILLSVLVRAFEPRESTVPLNTGIRVSSRHTVQHELDRLLFVRQGQLLPQTLSSSILSLPIFGIFVREPIF